jgi:beta-lactamase class A
MACVAALRLVVDRKGRAQRVVQGPLGAVTVPIAPQPVSVRPWVPAPRRPVRDGLAALAAFSLIGGALVAGSWAGGLLPVPTWQPTLPALSFPALPPVPALPALRALRALRSDAAEPVAPAPVDLSADALAALDDSALPAIALQIVSSPAPAWRDVALEARLEAAIPPDAGHLAVSVRHLPTGASANVNAGLALPPASVFKLGVLGAVFEERAAGRLALDERLWLLPEDWADGAGVLQGRIGDAISLEEAVRLMIGVSDNVAANALLRRVSWDTVNAWYASHGFTHTHLYPDDRPDATTAADTAALLSALATGQLAGEDDTRLMLQFLAQDQPAAWIRDGLSPDAIVAHKSGQLRGIRNDAAIVYGAAGPYVLVVLGDELADDAAGEALISRLATVADTYLAGAYPPALFAYGGS